MMKTLGIGLVSALALGSAVQAQNFPERPIQMIVPWGAGGGTDAVARILASVIQQELDTPVNVVNRTGGSGVVGHSAIATADPDGYTIGLGTVEIAMMHWQGLTDLTYQDYDILGIVNLDPAGIMVSAASEYDSAGALLEAIKSQPAGTFNASGTAQGGIWHVAMAGWLLDEGVEPDRVSWIPSQGASAAITDMVAGGTDIVTSSLAEGLAMIEADRVRPLATMSDNPSALLPDVPTLENATGSDFQMNVWRGIFTPKGLPEDVRKTLGDAVEVAFNSPEYQDFMKSRGLGAYWVPADEAATFVGDADAALGEVMKAAGLATQ